MTTGNRCYLTNGYYFFFHPNQQLYSFFHCKQTYRSLKIFVYILFGSFDQLAFPIEMYMLVLHVHVQTLYILYLSSATRCHTSSPNLICPLEKLKQWNISEAQNDLNNLSWKNKPITSGHLKSQNEIAMNKSIFQSSKHTNR